MTTHPFRRPSHAALCAAALSTLALPLQAEQAYEAWHHAAADATNAAGEASNATATDSRGNVIVAGFTGASGGPKNFYFAKLDAVSGSVVWSRSITTGPVGGVANAVTVDSQDNVIVTGRMANANGINDYLTIKCQGSDGVTLWQKSYAGPQGGADEATAVLVDHQNNVVVTGTSLGNGTQEDWFTIKYDGTNGSSLWGGNVGGIRQGGSGNQKDVPTGLVVDSANNVVLVGKMVGASGKSTFAIAKLAAANGSTVWSAAPNPNQGGDSEATGVALDKTGRVVVTGIARNLNNARSGFTYEYSSTGTLLWTAPYDSGAANYSGGPVGVVVDGNGDAIVTGTHQFADSFGSTGIYTTKIAGASSANPGSLLWEQNSPSLGKNDAATGIAIDDGGNVTVIGKANNAKNHDSDFYIGKYAFDDGRELERFYYNGADGEDVPKSVVLDSYGNAVVTGVSSLPYEETNIRYDRMYTAKYNRLRLSVGDDAPEAGLTGSGVPIGAKITSVGTPALADNGSLTALITVVKGNSRLQAVVRQSAGGANRLLAVQGQPAAGAGGGNYLSFLDPVISPEGSVAFTAKLSGVAPSQALGVWYVDATNVAKRKLQTGVQVPDLAAGLTLKAISSVSCRNQDVVALIQVAGAGVTPQNSTVLYGAHAVFGGNVILRTGDLVGNQANLTSPIKAISAFQPAAGAAGEGRAFSSTSLTTLLTLQDKTEVVVKCSIFGGSPTVLAYTGSNLLSSTKMALGQWATLSLPAVGSANQNFVFAGTLKHENLANGTTTASNDQVLVQSVDGQGVSLMAREGDKAADANSFLYGSFQDPTANSLGDVAFFGTLKGNGLTAKNNKALWWGAGATPDKLEIVAKLGAAAPDATGAFTSGYPSFAALLSVALPGGTKAGPLFLAKVHGSGVTAQNNLGLWALDSTGLVRQILRTGDTIGLRKVKTITVLQPTHGALSVTRSYNETGSVEALVGFSDHTSGIMHLAIP